MKRNLVIFLIIALALVAGFIYFTKDEVSFLKETSVYKAIPVTSPVFIEFSSLKSVPLKNPLIQEMMNAEIGASFFILIEKLDTIIKNQKEIQNGLRNEPFILALSFAGKSDLFPVIIKKADNNNKRKSLEKLVETLYPEGNFVYEPRNYSGNKITKVSSQNTDVLHFCFSGGLFIASPKAILVEQAIRQFNTSTILDNNYFTRVKKTVSSQSEFSLYINHHYFPDLLANWLNGKSAEIINEFGETHRWNYKNEIESFKDFASWSELDLKIDEDKITFNGISSADDSLNNFLSVFNNQEVVKFNADEVLPNNTSFFLSFTFSNKEQFFNNLETYFSNTDAFYKREEQIKKIESGFRVDFKSVFQQLVSNEVIVATTVVPVEPVDKTTLFIIHTEGKTAAAEQLNVLLTNYTTRKKVELSSLESVYSVDNETEFSIFNFPYPSFPEVWLGKPFGLAKANYVALHENYLVFSNTKKGLQEYLHSMVLDATLAKDIRYLQFKQNVSNRSNINVYFDINRGFGFGKEIFNSEILKQISEKEETARKIQAINWQVLHDKALFFNSLVLSFNQQAQEEAQTTWQSNIGGQINFKPQLVVNHDNKANREVILQDDQNKLHLVTTEGRIRWTVSIPEPILSEIFQIDYYKNGNLQYLFNTKSKLYLLDRNGNNVARFPITFRSPATNPVSVFDYDNNRNYRYFVACEDKKVAAYDYDGKIISGWEFGQTDYIVTTPVQHFRVANKDYIVFKDQSRIYIQDRRGQTRISTSAKFENSNNQLFLNLNGTPKIVATDKNGKVYYIYFDGKYAEKKTDNFSENHFFAVDDINGNGVPDFVFIDGKELKVMDENGKKLYSEKFENQIKNKPNIYTFSSTEKKVGIVDAAGNRIYLFNSDGKLYEGFPLQGSSEFSIGKMSESSGSLNLVVGSEGGNLFNYTLN